MIWDLQRTQSCNAYSYVRAAGGPRQGPQCQPCPRAQRLARPPAPAQRLARQRPPPPQRLPRRRPPPQPPRRPRSVSVRGFLLCCVPTPRYPCQRVAGGPVLTAALTGPQEPLARSPAVTWFTALCGKACDTGPHLHPGAPSISPFCHFTADAGACVCKGPLPAPKPEPLARPLPQQPPLAGMSCPTGSST